MLGAGLIREAHSSIALALALIAIVASRKVVKTWDDTQLSYRLKRRKRLG